MLYKSKLFIVFFSAFTASFLWSGSVTAQPDRRGFDRPGVTVRVLPRQHRIVSLRGRDYFYGAGRFYERRGARYVVVTAPIGARVRSLPAGFVSFGIGNRRYYYVNATYFLWDNDSEEYEVVEAPDGADAILGDDAAVTDLDLYVYPTAGQTEEQRDQDRYECHLWAGEQTGFDPSMSDQDVAMASDYKRAISACLEGRGYTVK